MNKKSLVFLTLSAGLILASCGQKAPTLDSIDIGHLPNKVEYVPGEQLDLTGLVVKAVYSDQHIEEVPNGEYTTSDVDMLTEGEKEVVVTYKEKTANFTVLVTLRHETYSDVPVIDKQSFDDKAPWVPGHLAEKALEPVVDKEGLQFDTKHIANVNIGNGIMSVINDAGNLAFYSRATERFITGYEFVPGWLTTQLYTNNTYGVHLVGGLLLIKHKNVARIVDTFGNVYLKDADVTELNFGTMTYSFEQARDCVKGKIVIPHIDSPYVIDEHFYKIDLKGVMEEITEQAYDDILPPREGLNYEHNYDGPEIGEQFNDGLTDLNNRGHYGYSMLSKNSGRDLTFYEGEKKISYLRIPSTGNIRGFVGNTLIYDIEEQLPIDAEFWTYSTYNQYTDSLRKFKISTYAFNFKNGELHEYRLGIKLVSLTPILQVAKKTPIKDDSGAIVAYDYEYKTSYSTARYQVINKNKIVTETIDRAMDENLVLHEDLTGSVFAGNLIRLDEDLFIFNNGGSYEVLNEKGDLVFTLPSNIQNYVYKVNLKMFFVRLSTNYWGALDKTGKVVIPFKYTNIRYADCVGKNVIVEYVKNNIAAANRYDDAEDGWFRFNLETGKATLICDTSDDHILVQSIGTNLWSWYDNSYADPIHHYFTTDADLFESRNTRINYGSIQLLGKYNVFFFNQSVEYRDDNKPEVRKFFNIIYDNFELDAGKDPTSDDEEHADGVLSGTDYKKLDEIAQELTFDGKTMMAKPRSGNYVWGKVEIAEEGDLIVYVKKEQGNLNSARILRAEAKNNVAFAYTDSWYLDEDRATTYDYAECVENAYAFTGLKVGDTLYLRFYLNNNDSNNQLLTVETELTHGTSIPAGSIPITFEQEFKFLAPSFTDDNDTVKTTVFNFVAFRGGNFTISLSDKTLKAYKANDDSLINDEIVLAAGEALAFYVKRPVVNEGENKNLDPYLDIDFTVKVTGTEIKTGGSNYLDAKVYEKDDLAFSALVTASQKAVFVKFESELGGRFIVSFKDKAGTSPLPVNAQWMSFTKGTVLDVNVQAANYGSINGATDMVVSIPALGGYAIIMIAIPNTAIDEEHIFEGNLSIAGVGGSHIGSTFAEFADLVADGSGTTIIYNSENNPGLFYEFNNTTVAPNEVTYTYYLEEYVEALVWDAAIVDEKEVLTLRQGAYTDKIEIKPGEHVVIMLYTNEELEYNSTTVRTAVVSSVGEANIIALKTSETNAIELPIDQGSKYVSYTNNTGSDLRVKISFNPGEYDYRFSFSYEDSFKYTIGSFFVDSTDEPVDYTIIVRSGTTYYFKVTNDVDVVNAITINIDTEVITHNLILMDNEGFTGSIEEGFETKASTEQIEDYEEFTVQFYATETGVLTFDAEFTNNFFHGALVGNNTTSQVNLRVQVGGNVYNFTESDTIELDVTQYQLITITFRVPSAAWIQAENEYLAYVHGFDEGETTVPAPTVRISNIKILLVEND